MKGLDLAREYYLEFGAPMIKKDFPELESLIAIGLILFLITAIINMIGKIMIKRARIA